MFQTQPTWGKLRDLKVQKIETQHPFLLLGRPGGLAPKWNNMYKSTRIGWDVSRSTHGINPAIDPLIQCFSGTAIWKIEVLNSQTNHGKACFSWEKHSWKSSYIWRFFTRNIFELNGEFPSHIWGCQSVDVFSHNKQHSGFSTRKIGFVCTDNCRIVSVKLGDLSWFIWFSRHSALSSRHGELFPFIKLRTQQLLDVLHKNDFFT